MELLTKLLKAQIAIANKFSDGLSVEKSRSLQEKLGELMAYKYRRDIKLLLSILFPKKQC